MKLKLTVAAFLLSAGTAFAGCQGPELEFSADHEIGTFHNGDADNTTNFGAAITIPLGSIFKKLCLQELLLGKARTEVEYARVTTEEAKARDEDANAHAQELDNLDHKLKICADFTYDEAPRSIREFCGDLL